MPVYLQQTNEYDCAPVAVVNLLKWLGILEIDGKKINKQLMLIEISAALRLKEKGVWVYWVNVFFKKLVRYGFINLMECVPLYYQEMAKWTSNPDSCVVFWYSIYTKEDKVWDEHICLVTEFDGETYTTVNMTSKLVDKITVKQMKKCFRPKRNPRGWIIWRKNTLTNR